MVYNRRMYSKKLNVPSPLPRHFFYTLFTQVKAGEDYTSIAETGGDYCPSSSPCCLALYS